MSKIITQKQTTKKLIRIDVNTYETLRQLGKMGDTFDSVVTKLLHECSKCGQNNVVEDQNE